MSDEKKKEESFRVIDRRGEKSEENSDRKGAKSQGEGFTMKDADKSSAPSGAPTVDFSTFVFSLASSTYISLGLAPDPSTKKEHKNVEFARQNIEVLSMIKEKTKGNLSTEEAELLTHLLADVQLRYVEVSKKA